MYSRLALSVGRRPIRKQRKQMMLLVNPSGCLLFAVPKQVYFVPEFVQHQPNHADNIIIYLDDTDNTVHLEENV